MKPFKFLILFSLLVLSLIAIGCSGVAPTPTPPPTVQLTTPVPGATPVVGAPTGSPIILNGKAIMYIRSREGSLSPEERARLVSQRLQTIADNPFRTDLEVKAVDSDAGTDIYVGGDFIATVTDVDARNNNIDRFTLAQRVAAIIQQEMIAARQEINVTNRLRGLAQTIILFTIVVALLWLVNRVYRRIERSLNTDFVKRWESWSRTDSMRYASQPVRLVLLFLLRVARILIWLLLLIVLIPMALSFFPGTQELYKQLLALVQAPLIDVWEGFVQFLPNLFFILVIAVIAWFIIRTVRAFFDQIEKGTLRLGGFESEWAPLTKSMVTLLLIALTLVVIFPYLPFSDAPAFQGISVFLALLFTLASSSVVSNLIAGVLLTYNGAFRVGDLVDVGSTLGTVVEKRLFTTRVRTFKNEEISIPNSVVIGASIRNYSVLAAGNGLILHSEVTIGYDAPWRQVHELMIEAAKATPGVSAEPSPFVLQRALNDWHISYEINAYTHEPQNMPRIMSALMGNIQDKFNEAGVEIMSPSFYALRDGNTVTIPPDQRAADYASPAFRVDIEQGNHSKS